MEQLDYSAEDFSDIVAKDGRYAARAYTLLRTAMDHLSGEEGDKHASGEAICEEFRNTALDQFGPMTLSVLTEWGLKSCEDLGEMMFNLCESGRVVRDENDTFESFAGGYDFREAFAGPYET